MITHLHLTNFLRHADTDLRFDPDQQLVVVDGDNGSGKSSIFHGVTWALYGEAPKGRKVAELVRRGSEIEGCQVQLEFTIGEDTYQVTRRRDGAKTSATLYVNDAAVCEGAAAVTEQITRILGMDVAGFRVAFVAEQGELDGLASLRPAERAKMLSRLLRLDAIEAAKLRARDIYNSERRVVHALGSDLDVADLDRTLTEAVADRDLYDTQLADARAAVAELDGKLAGSADVERAYRDATTALTRAEAAAEAATGDVDRAREDLARVVVPEPVDMGEVSSSDLAEQLRELEAQVVRAESAAELVEQRAMSQREVDRAADRLQAVDDELAELAGRSDLADATDTLARASTAQDDAALDLEDARDRLAAAQVRHDLAAARVAELDELGAACDRCGQQVGDDHRHTMAEQAADTLADAEQALARATEQVTEATGRLQQAKADIAAAHEARSAATQAAGRVQALTSEKAELVRRRDTYAASVARLPAEPVDLEALYERKAELALAHSEATAAEKAALARAQAIERRDELAGRLTQAEQRLAAMRDGVTAAAVPTDVAAAHEQLAATKQARDAEMELVTHLAAEHAGAVERVAAAERDVERAHRALDRRRRHQLKAQTAENAAMLLGEVSEILATQIRPALEGAVSDLLARLSDGRFTQVRISDAYDVQVLDDGSYVELAALSGGEQDLVALAVRLGLAEVVTARHGVGGIGTLVLDEVFGSQDASRQASICTALRSLRDVYGQILLISHVGGLDEAADAVVTVTTTPDRSETEVHVT